MSFGACANGPMYRSWYSLRAIAKPKRSRRWISAPTISSTSHLVWANFSHACARHRVTRVGEEVKLTPKEFELLSFLARHAGKVITHKQIMSAVWGPAHAQDTQYLRVYVGHLRQKIEDNPDDPKIVVTEPGIGYRIMED